MILTKMREIQEFLVDNGDHVEAGQPLAKVDRVTMLSALSEAQDSINILTEKMQVALRDAEYSWIQSQAVGRVKGIYAKEEINDIDGVKIDFPDKWVHLRKSNTEPIIRVYSEASTMEAANAIGEDVMKVINSMI